MISEGQIKEVMRLADKIANYAWKEGFAYGEHSNSEQDHECRAETRAELEAYLRTIEPAQSVNAELLDALKDARHCIGIDRDTLVDCHTNPCTGYLDPDGALAKAEYDDVIDAADAAIARAESINEISNLPDVPPINEGNSPCSGYADKLPDHLGLLSCTHPDCGRFKGPHSYECRAMADNACARPSIGQGHTRKNDMAEAIATVHEECAKVAEGWETEVSGQKYQTSGNGNFWDAGTQYDQGRIDAAVSIRFLLKNKKSGNSIPGRRGCNG